MLLILYILLEYCIKTARDSITLAINLLRQIYHTTRDEQLLAMIQTLTQILNQLNSLLNQLKQLTAATELGPVKPKKTIPITPTSAPTQTTFPILQTQQPTPNIKKLQIRFKDNNKMIYEGRDKKVFVYTQDEQGRLIRVKFTYKTQQEHDNLLGFLQKENVLFAQNNKVKFHNFEGIIDQIRE